MFTILKNFHEWILSVFSNFLGVIVAPIFRDTRLTKFDNRPVNNFRKLLIIQEYVLGILCPAVSLRNTQQTLLIEVRPYCQNPLLCDSPDIAFDN